MSKVFEYLRCLKLRTDVSLGEDGYKYIEEIEQMEQPLKELRFYLWAGLKPEATLKEICERVKYTVSEIEQKMRREMRGAINVANFAEIERLKKEISILKESK